QSHFGLSQFPVISFTGLFVVFVALWFIAYHTTFIFLTKRTAGKAMFGLRLRRRGQASELLWALGRASVGYIVIDMFGAGTVLSFWTPRHQCLHDLLFGSEVILERPGA